MTPKLRPKNSIFSASLGFAFLGLLAIAGCKQGEGDNCQVTSDCEEGLVCVPGISVCQKPGGSGGLADAAPRPDANLGIADAAAPDASPADAALADADVLDAGPPDAAPE